MIEPDIFLNLKKFKNRTAIIQEGLNTKSYEQLLFDTNIFKHTSLKRKVILVFCENNYETIVAYLGLIANKSVPYLVDNNIKKAEAIYILKKYKINYIYLPKKRLKEFKNFKKTFDFLQYSLIKINNYIYYKIFRNLTLLLSTSGSVGSPKCVRLSTQNIKSNSRSIIKFLNITKNNRVITTLNPSYSYGLSIINTHLLVGASIVLTNLTFFDKLFWKLLRDAKANTFGGVPFHYQVLQKIKFEQFNLPSLKYLTHAGGLIFQETKNYILKVCNLKKIKFISMYGATEATARMSYIPWKFKNKNANCIGKAIPGGRFWIEGKNNGKIYKHNQVGELIYSGNNVSLGYSNTYKDLCKGDQNKKILKTGDLARLGNDNYYYLVGRKSRMIKVNGYRVDLDFIEIELKRNKIYSMCSGQDDKLEVFYINHNLKDKILNIIKKFKVIRKDNLKLMLVNKSHSIFHNKKNTKTYDF